MWNGEKLDADKDSRTRGSYVLKREVIGENGLIERTLKGARKTVPSKLGNIPKKFSQFKSFKAADWQDFMEVYGVTLMYENLEDDALLNLVKLHEVWRLATRRSFSKIEVSQLRQACLDFVKSYQKLYYQDGIDNRVQACSINHHWLLHLADGITENGPCCYNWSYPLERYCFTVKKLARSKSKIAKSISNALLRNEQLNSISILKGGIDDRQLNSGVGVLIEYPQLIRPIHHPLPQSRVQVDSSGQLLAQLRQIANITFDPAEITYWRQCKLEESLTIGSVASQRKYDLNRIDHFVCYTSSDTPDSPCSFGSIHVFLRSPSGQDYAVIRRWTGLQSDTSIHQITYEGEDGEWVLVKPRYILCLVGVLKERDLEIEGRVLKIIVGPPTLTKNIIRRGLASS